MTTQKAPRKIKLALMNAVHDLAVLVAREEGYFDDEGLDIEYVTTPGQAQVTTDSNILKPIVFDRPLDSLYSDGGLDQFRMCEWGIMKRAVEGNASGLRPRKIVALGAAMSSFAIVVRSDSDIYEPEQLKNKPVAVTPFNGSNFVTLKMMEGFLAKEYIKTVNAGNMRERLEKVGSGEIAAASLMDPWISVAQKQGYRILIESHSTRSEAASDEMDGPTLAAIFRAQGRAAKKIMENPGAYAHHMVAETGGLLKPEEFQTFRMLYTAPQPYTRERFEDTYNWTVSWGMCVDGATYEMTVDNRAWE